MTRNMFSDYTGKLVTAPRDLRVIVADYQDGLIVWSRSGQRKHQVRYALQKREFQDIEGASQEFANCVAHDASCRGVLP